MSRHAHEDAPCCFVAWCVVVGCCVVVRRCLPYRRLRPAVAAVASSQQCSPSPTAPGDSDRRLNGLSARRQAGASTR